MKHQGRLHRILTVGLLLVFTMVTAGAATYYVREDGNDLNSGTANTPAGAFLTINRAIFSLGPNDVLIIDGNGTTGTYNEGGVSIGVSGNITFRGTTPNRPTLLNLTLGVSGQNVTFENLIVDGNAARENVIHVFQGSDGFTLRNCEVRNPLNANPNGFPHGNVIVEAANNLLIDDCRLIAAPPSTTAGLLFNLATRADFGACGNWTVRNTEFALVAPDLGTGNGGGNIAFYQGMSDLIIRDCTFTTAPREHILVVGGADSGSPATFANWLIERNGFQETTVVTSLYIGRPCVLVNWVVKDNVWRDIADAAFWISGGNLGTDLVGTVIDGMEITNNYFENVGRSNALADAAILMDGVSFIPTSGRRTLISNNYVKNTRGENVGGWGMYFRGNGQGPVISANTFDHQGEACILTSGAPYAHMPNYGAGMTNTSIVGNTIVGNRYGGIILQTVHTQANTTVENNTVADCRNFGVSIEGASVVNSLVRLNDIANCGMGIQFSGQRTIVRNNEIFNTTTPGSYAAIRAGISIAPLGSAVNDDAAGSRVSYNLLTGCAGYGIRAATEWGKDVPDVEVYNNTIVGNQPNGMLIGIDNLDVYNNIFAYHTGSALVWGATTQGAIGYNLFFNTITGGQNFTGFPVATPFAGDIVNDNPLFVDFFGLDFHLQGGSPAIQTGAVLAGVNLVPGGVDMGAYPTGTVSASVKPADWTLYR